MVRFTGFRAYLKSPFKSSATSTSPQRQRQRPFRPNAPSPLANDYTIHEPIMSTFETDIPPSPLPQEQPPQSPIRSTPSQQIGQNAPIATTLTSNESNEPRTFTISIINLSESASSPLPSPLSSHNTANKHSLRVLSLHHHRRNNKHKEKLQRSSSRGSSRPRRRLTTRISIPRFNSSSTSPPAPVSVRNNDDVGRPNSYFGTGFAMPFDELEKAVEEVNEMSSRQGEGGGWWLDKGKEESSRGGPGVAYVPL